MSAYVGTSPAPSGLVLVGDTNPIGAIAFFHAPPDGSWLRLNGQSVNSATYPDLWAYAQSFLTTDQVTNPGLYKDVGGGVFALPNLDGLFIRGLGGNAAALGVKQGFATGSPTGTPAGHSNLTAGASGGTVSFSYVVGNVHAGTPWDAETRPINVALVPCVKALRAVLMPSAAMPVQAVQLLGDKTAASSASLDFTNLTGYAAYRFVLSHLVPTSAGGLLLRMSVDNGATYDAGSTYGYEAGGMANQAVYGGAGAAIGAANAIALAHAIHLDPNHGVSGEVLTNDFAGAGLGYVTYSTTWYHASGYAAQLNGSGGRYVPSIVNAVRFLAASGNLLKGRIRCYGMRGA